MSLVFIFPFEFSSLEKDAFRKVKFLTYIQLELANLTFYVLVSDNVDEIFYPFFLLLCDEWKVVIQLE